MLKIIILSISVLQACKVTSARECSDCQTYTSCKRAADLAIHNRDDDTQRKFERAYCGFDEDEQLFKVCCSDFDVPKVEARLQNADAVISTTPEQTDVSDKLQLLPEMCGDIDGSRIVGGNIAKLYEFPWMALISHRIGGGLMFGCSGSIINKRYILTAAHCVDKANKVAGVRLGELDTSSEPDCQELQGQFVCESHKQDTTVEKIILHESYNREGARNDIALLRLEQDIDFSHPNVGAICLPVYTNLRNKTLIGEKATVAGWGKTETSLPSNVLRKVAVRIVESKSCLGDDTRGRFCAGERNKDSCAGDSGGPLMLEEDYNDVDRFVQFGIVSKGPLACGSDTPAVYTDVTKYIDWILEKIEP